MAMSKSRRHALVLLAGAALAVSLGGAPAHAAPPTEQVGAAVTSKGPDSKGRSDVARTSKPLAKLPTAQSGLSVAPDEGLGVGEVTAGPSEKVADAVLQAEIAAGDAPQELTDPLVSFAGQAGANPPDPNGDVGPDHYVQTVNTTIQVWDKQGNSLAGPTNINQIWINATTAGSGFDQCRNQNAGDPIVLYDQQVDRWMVSQFTNPSSPTGPGNTFPMCIAYSQTGDPTQNWFVYQFNLPAAHDYMKYGIWPDGLYMSTWEGGTVGAYVFDRSAMIGGSGATFQAFTGIGSGTGVDNRGGRLVPSDWDGDTPPPSGAPNYFTMSFDDAFDGGNDRIALYEFHTDWAVPGNTTFAQVSTMDTAAFDTDLNCSPSLRDCIPQPGTTGKLDAISNRLMARLQYRNFGDHESMVINQTVDADGNDRAGVRWYELRRDGGPWSIHQQGTYGPTDGVHRWMGAAAMDGQGNIAIGYSVSDGTSTFPGLRYTGRLEGDPLGAMTQGEHVLATGTSVETSNRWGDYSGLVVDPVDDCTFWFTGERDNSQTSIGSFRFPSCQAADLEVTKTDVPDPVTAGEDLTYTLEVTNHGPATATDVVLTDTLPAGVDLVTAPDCTESGGVVTCELGDLLPGQTVVRAIQVDVPADILGSATSGILTNTATVEAPDQADPDLSNNTATTTTTVQASADLAVTKVCKPDSSAAAGETAFCDIHVDNLGPSDAVGVELTDVLTSATPFTVTNVAVSPGGTCAPTSGGPTTSFTTTCDLGTEPAGGRSTIHVEVTAADVAEVNDVATVTADTPDPVTSNNTAEGTLVFTGSADLALTKDGPTSVVAGEGLTYEIGVTNTGPSTAHDVVVTDTLPLGVSFVSVTPSTGSCTYGQPDARDLACNLGNLASGASATITVEADVAPDVLPGTLLVNKAGVSSSTADPDNANDIASVTTAVEGSADVSVTKTDSPDPVLAGELLTYTLTAANDGPSTAYDVVVEDNLPDGTSFVSGVDDNGATVCAEIQPDIVRCAVGTLDPGDSATIEITVQVDPDVPDGTTLTNEAEVTSTTPDPDPSDNTTTEDTDVATEAELWIDKQAENRSGNPAPVVVYTLVVHNDTGCEEDAQSSPTPTCGAGGPSDAQDVEVVDTLPLTPKKLTVQYVSPQCTYDESAHTVTCSADTVPAGASVTFVIEAQVQGSVGTITNTAALTSGTDDPVSGNNTDSASLVMKGGTGKGKGGGGGGGKK
jgi:uncharacterized repeat protein (TIGR01451 family)